LILTIVFCEGLHFSPPCVLAVDEEPQSPKELWLYTFENRDAKPEDRLAALGELVKDPPTELGEAFLRVLADPEEDVKLQSLMGGIILKCESPDVFHSLERAVSDREAGTPVRDFALSLLWKKEPERALALTRTVAVDSRENPEFRLRAFQYLRTAPDAAEDREVATKILLNPAESDAMRREAVQFLFLGSDVEATFQLLLGMAKDPAKDRALREFAFEEVKTMRFAELPQALLEILRNSEETDDMRRFVMSRIAAQLAEFVPYLEDLEAIYRNRTRLKIYDKLSDDLAALIKKLKTASTPAGESSPLPNTF
jgi:hypothetical protein